MGTHHPSLIARLAAAICRWVTHSLLAPTDGIPCNLSKASNPFNSFGSFNRINPLLAPPHRSCPSSSMSSLRRSMFNVALPRLLAAFLPAAFLLLASQPCSAASPPPNDDCSTALIVSTNNYANTEFTTDATSTNDPSPDCAFSFGSGVWYQYTPATNGVMVVDTLGSTFDTVMAVYTGTCGSLTQVACNDDANGSTSASRAAILAAASTTYYILAGGYGGGNGKLVFHLVFTTSTVANDRCGGAILISGPNYTNTQSTLNATSTGDPASIC